jgi:hypothetical protein
MGDMSALLREGSFSTYGDSANLYAIFLDNEFSREIGSLPRDATLFNAYTRTTTRIDASTC